MERSYGSNYSEWKSLCKHFGRLSTFDKLDLIRKLWSNASSDNLSKKQHQFLDKISLNAQGYAGTLECDEDVDEILKYKFL